MTTTHTEITFSAKVDGINETFISSIVADNNLYLTQLLSRLGVNNLNKLEKDCSLTIDTLWASLENFASYEAYTHYVLLGGRSTTRGVVTEFINDLHRAFPSIKLPLVSIKFRKVYHYDGQDAARQSNSFADKVKGLGAL